MPDVSPALDEVRYGRDYISGLVWGEIWAEFGPKEVPTWAQLRSSVEHHGNVDSDAWLTVMDIERELRLLATRPMVRDLRERGLIREAKQGAALLSCALLLDWDAQDFAAAFGRIPGERLVTKSIAWISARLNGGTLEEADQAFRKAR